MAGNLLIMQNIDRLIIDAGAGGVNGWAGAAARPFSKKKEEVYK
jgi:hypothetical protein